MLSSGVAAKNSRALHPKSHASGSVGIVEILGVVAIDLVVVELPAVGDHRLEPLDLVLQVEDVLLGLDRGIRLDDGEQGANGAEVASAWTAWAGIGSVGE